MAYISTETTALIRKALKEAYPKSKFSIRKDAGSYSLTVCIMQSSVFDDGDEFQVNHHWIDKHFADKPEQAEMLNGIQRVIRTVGEWYNNSDAMTDYFDTAFYYHINVGQWNKPHKKV